MQDIIIVCAIADEVTATGLRFPYPTRGWILRPPNLLPPLTEEINILYVAVTRARSFLFIPDAVFSATPHEWADRPRVVTPYPVEDRDDIPARRGARWTPESDAWLRRCFDAGLPLQVIARMFGRTYTSIRSRLQHLELIEASSPYSAPSHVNAIEKRRPNF